MMHGLRAASAPCVPSIVERYGNVGWVRCALYRFLKLPLDYRRTVTQQCSDGYLCITILA